MLRLRAVSVNYEEIWFVVSFDSYDFIVTCPSYTNVN